MRTAPVAPGQFEDLASKATYRPSGNTAALELTPSACPPDKDTLTRWVLPVPRSRTNKTVAR